MPDMSTSRRFYGVPMTWRARPQSWTHWAFVALLCVGLYSACESLCACSAAQRKAVVHVVAENCERLELPEPVCVAVEDLAPFLAVLLAAQREGRDAVVQVRDAHGVSHELVIPLARIPGAVGSVTGAAVGAANRGAK